jgi:colanic acid/amylovoran biosynthesis glycosyltransferase
MNNRILIFTDNYPFGKSEPFFESELKFIDEAFEKVTLFPFEQGKNKNLREIPAKSDFVKPVFNKVKKKKELIIKGIFNTSMLICLVKEGIRSGAWKSVTKFRIWATHLLVIRSLMKEIKNRDLLNFFNKFDILYFYWGLRWSQILPFLPPDISAKVVVRFHGSDLYEHTNKGYIPWRVEQLNRIYKAVSISESGKKYMENQYPFLKDKILISRIGTKDYGLNKYVKSDTLRIASCSNLVPVKRVDLIVKTLAFVKVPVHWVHFGDGPEIREVKDLVSQLPENIKTELNGSVRHEDIMKYYSENPVDLFLNVSSSEGVPVSVMEAMSFGIPVIATDVGGTSEIVSEKNGLLIAADFSPEYLASNIEAISKRSDLLNLRSASRAEWEKKSKAEDLYPAFINQLLNI